MPVGRQASRRETWIGPLGPGRLEVGLEEMMDGRLRRQRSRRVGNVDNNKESEVLGLYDEVMRRGRRDQEEEDFAKSDGVVSEVRRDMIELVRRISQLAQPRFQTEVKHALALVAEDATAAARGER